MTVRTYEEKYSPCAICCEPTMCATSRHVEIRVEGGDVVPFAVCESCVRNMARPFSQPAPPRSPYKDSVQLTVECEGKAGDVIEKRLTTDRACKPMKSIVIDSDPGAVSVTLHLASTGQNALRRDGYVPAAYFESPPLSSGMSLPTLYIDEAYVFSFKFERDARIKICLFGPMCRDPRLTIAEGSTTLSSRLTQDALALAAKVSEDAGPMDLGLGPTIPPERRAKIAQQLQGEQVQAMSRHIVELQGHAERLTVALRRAADRLGDSAFARELEAVLEADGIETDDESPTAT